MAGSITGIASGIAGAQRKGRVIGSSLVEVVRGRTVTVSIAHQYEVIQIALIRYVPERQRATFDMVVKITSLKTTSGSWKFSVSKKSPPSDLPE